MLGIANFGAFCAAILASLALPGPGRFPLPMAASPLKGVQHLGSIRVRAYGRAARALERHGGILLIAFGLRPGAQ